ncbi:MAG TPA: hypothetical protein VKV73_26945 [Chloroflexota bacterium]|nr:hypothetical protein [Chloroflexota bacterium]
MPSHPDYFEVHIDVFEQLNQRAQIVPELSPAELVSAILEEFGGDLDYLGPGPEQYRLRKSESTDGLDNHLSVGEQVAPGERLVLEERDTPLPSGAARPSVPIYLQDVGSRHSFRVAWLPAFVGRADPNTPGNELLAVDLSTASGGSNVSRRHLKLWEDKDGFRVQAASNNPAAVVRQDGVEVPMPQPPDSAPLQSRDVIRLERSGLALKFIVREQLP